MKMTYNKYINKKAYYLTLLIMTFLGNSIFAQERWFQIEVSIFSNEVLADRLEEGWEPNKTELNYPENLRRLNLLSDLFLTEPIADTIEFSTSQILQQEIESNARERILKLTNPKTMVAEKNFKLFDFDREAYVQLSNNESDFQQTNQALQRSNDHRLLFHGLWRQPVTQESRAIPVLIEGGLTYGDDHELQGSLMIRFNQNEDRVVIDANVWLIEFSAVQNTEENWVVPNIPESLIKTNNSSGNSLRYSPQNIYHMSQSRDMRSMEFHYLDHPGLGLVVLVKPYDLPSI